MLSIDEAPALRDSSLFRLYRAGVRELDKREVGRQNVSLSGASLDAVKAAVDADMVRETHKLNARMVLLTIAISGGPFLGLLGTVVGVMITFAAIAAAGDVNVNAIAPGIAAALLATVAGLGVAIPALFGYNWLASRIKNISADMQIFVDEFITRVAERYGAR
jgi:biopolymer transport protein ExbB